MTGKETGAAKRMRLSRQRNNGIICNNVTPVLQTVTQSKSKSIEKDTEKESKLKDRINETLKLYHQEL